MQECQKGSRGSRPELERLQVFDQIRRLVVEKADVQDDVIVINHVGQRCMGTIVKIGWVLPDTFERRGSSTGESETTTTKPRNISMGR